MKKMLFLAASFAALLVLSGCASERLPAEDIEVPEVCADIIRVLKNPALPANSKEKYEAAKKLLKKVDFSFIRETKTINDIFYHGDALIDFPQQQDRNISFNYQYKNNYVRFQFRTFRTFVLRADITEK